MKRKSIIGVDIGGTNTDAVLVNQENEILFAKKTTTTTSIEVGFKTVLEEILQMSKLNPEEISGIFVGTTHATNALLQKKDLFKVGVLRLSSDTGNCLPSCYSWPADMREAIFVGHVSVDGGFECDGRAINPLNVEEITKAFIHLESLGMQSLAIVGVFSPLNHQQEDQVLDIAKVVLGEDFPITLSYRVGGVGIINRENATILNATLKRSMKNGFNALKQVMNEVGLTCPLHLTQNNGTIIPLEEALEYPVLTISAGPTNSFIGSAKICGLDDAVVVDVGGTSTDVGIVLSGLPRRSVDSSSIGGVSLNFPMPDVLSIGLGGGSYIELNKAKEQIKIGPLSCGKDLKTEALSFGGNRLTLTDAAVAKGLIDLSGEKIVPPDLDAALVEKILMEAQKKVQELTRIMGGVHKHLPIILTGGGSAIFKNMKADDKTYIIPKNAGVANAYGAALAEISGTMDTVLCLDKREETIGKLQREAELKAIQLGAREETLRVVSLEIVPYHYLPQNLARVKVTVAGKRNF